ncbi:hypothetical protein [Fulvivirga sedimenti]|uniref:Uncharacterized protein n=1 Tax=Fulvivirga sedimenti TaxID=2879465 RepID=A0A9X1KZM3_9BACT|nr:hypothetical protein [Fulvivirga sedimenti]MCA6074859.1 hypothetical protein [Fulvivirga sedimenti]MCA6076036.1 hypothetical protein [Fulvivirga sedimenti]MCA6077164.1 hypothetical protein [Fulvivirga sedimenti]
MMHRIIRVQTIMILVSGVFLLLLPNIFNARETAAFDGSDRLSGRYIIRDSDTYTTAGISDFYDRGTVITWLLGTHHRELWSVPVTLPVFQWMNDSSRLLITELGGGQQTTSFALEDENGLSYTLRSVNKDQANALPFWLQKTGIRTLFRDQASALDPFAATVVDRLARSAGIFSTQPKLYFIKDSHMVPEEYKKLLANRIMLLEIEPDQTWQGHDLTGRPQTVISSTSMLELLSAGKIKVNVSEYAYCRLFDIAIGDWDRHGKQWKWSVDSTFTAHPLPMDRDMAFYKFHDGLINALAIRVNPKFQSFVADIDDISGYLINGKELDSVLLPSISSKEWIRIADSLQTNLSESVIEDAFRAYPEPIYNRIGPQHAEILKQRIGQLNRVADQVSEVYTSSPDHGSEL